MKGKHLFVAGLLLVALTLVLAACSTPAVEATPCPTGEPCPTCPTCPEAEPCPEAAPCPEPVVKDVPFQELWANSSHNDAEAEAFVHWDEEDPAEVPTSCAKCHSTTGMLDFLGADGTEAGVVDAAVAVPGGTVACATCHNSATMNKTSVVFPSGVEVTGLDASAVCMECHQGRASKVQVDAQIEKFGVVEDVDTVPEPIQEGERETRLGFINVHYYAAAGTLYGGQVMAGYQYEGKTYDSKNQHVEGYATCAGCHNTHSLEVKIEECASCHEGVTTNEDLQAIRMVSSAPDYDGDGDTAEGMFFEVEGMQMKLYEAMQAYATNTIGTGVVYDGSTYPYFFADADGDGAADSGDEGPVRFSSWTARLLKAAYNYQVSLKDTGNYAHGNKYMVQLLYDSIEDLGSVDMAGMNREDAGHFAGDTEPFRHWDDEGEVPGSCAKCHSATGIETFVAEGVNVSAEPANGFMCSSCHNEAEWPSLYAVTEVTFPSGASITFSKPDADGNLVAEPTNLCLHCHQGRASGPTLERSLAGKEANTPDPAIRFSNVHYFAAGATLFGSEAQGAYEFEGKEYAGRHPHVTDLSFNCSSCHNVHALEVDTTTCAGCHAAASDPADPNTYQVGDTDWDGDGTVEPVKDEIAAFAERLYAGMQAYAKAAGTPILYDSHAYPYFFVDADDDGVADVGERGPVSYNAWSPNLVRAGYNYQYYQKDPGNFAHNAKYTMQFLYDSIAAVGGDTAGLTRP
jgi:hypothetical protein